MLHPSLPSHVSNVFAHDLQTKSLKDLQPRISEQHDDLLRQVDKTLYVEANFSFTTISPSGARFGNTRDNNKFSRKQYSSFKTEGSGRNNQFPRNTYAQKRFPVVRRCEACHSVGEPFIGHNIYSCPNIAPGDRSNMLKSFSLEVDPDGASDAVNDNDTFENAQVDFSHTDRPVPASVDRVNIVASPQFNVKINTTTITTVLDTGATGSMISLELCEMIGLQVYPASHSASLADGDSQLKVVGEVHSPILMENCLTLPLSALVVTKLKAGLIVGIAFMKEHKVVIDIPNNVLILSGNNTVRFNNQPGNPKVSLLRAEVNNVIFPGECVTLPAPVNFLTDSDLAVEPREESASWFHPCIVKNAAGLLSLGNDMDNPIKIKKGQIIGQVRSVVLPSDKPSADSIFTVSPGRMQHYNSKVDIIAVDPGNILNREEKLAFQNVNVQYNSVFNPQFGTYNERSGKVVASVHIGKTTPTPKKGIVPSYNSKKSSLLQDKFDELVNLGVLIRPEDNNIKVMHTSPSFLVKKPNNSYRLVTSFVELNKFIHPLPSKLCTTTDVLTALGMYNH